MDYSNYFTDGTAWLASHASSGTMVGMPQQAWTAGARSENGLHSHDTMWALVPPKGYTTYAVKPDTLHGVCDWALVGCAFGVAVVWTFRDD